ncbi:unnamed protein product [Polarella glacialis]|uniref:Uncharacterized protein n=1 Tax=Polarella glacialis TaxID=89957 RepID=A0A813E3I4_POLGL|nr:unnamed protein product [Polarella glacialis]|mmetsp:Transcript_12865/g.20364  ORF Transcript_12865/g.20364 Transcript_12865/m.20364 type:complete len:119 (-) Transcript_12865:89-445(-)
MAVAAAAVRSTARGLLSRFNISASASQSFYSPFLQVPDVHGRAGLQGLLRSVPVALPSQAQALVSIVEYNPRVVSWDEAPDSLPETLQAVSTRRELRKWKCRRKRDGGKDRNFRLKYG